MLKLITSFFVCMIALLCTGELNAQSNQATLKYQTSMKPGDKLLEGEKLVSANGKFQLRGTPDGDFVIEETSNGRLMYTFPLGGRLGDPPSVSFLSYNPDGNVCISSKKNIGYCTTNGQDAAASVILNKSERLVLTDRGRLVLVNSKGQEIWDTPKYLMGMKPGDKLLEGERMVTINNSKFQLRGTREGNFIIEDIPSGRVIYTFPLGGSLNNPPSVSYLSYNPDGNVCIESKQNKGYCATNGQDAVAPVVLHKSESLQLSTNGNLILINNKGQIIWYNK